MFDVVIPHLPLRAFGYLHSGVEAWIKSSGEVRKCSVFA